MSISSYRSLPASALQPEGPCEMFDAVLVLIFVCCPTVLSGAEERFAEERPGWNFT